MSIIQGKGIDLKKTKKKSEEDEVSWDFSNGFMETLKNDADWVQEKGQEVLAAFMLPPLQIIAAAINFLTLLINGSHLFELPFKTLDDIKPSNVLVETLSKKSEEELKTSASTTTSN